MPDSAHVVAYVAVAMSAASVGLGVGFLLRGVVG